MHRTLRIFPAYYLLLLIVTIFIPLVFPAIHAAYSYPGSSWGYWFYLSDLWIANHWLHMAWIRPLGPTWSLAVEEQFYIGWSLLIFFFCRSQADGDARKRAAIMALGLLAFCVVSRNILVGFALQKPVYMNALYYFGPTHLDGLCIGIVARAIYDRADLRGRLLAFSRSWPVWLLVLAGIVWLDIPAYARGIEPNFAPAMLRVGFLFLSLLSCAIMLRAILVNGLARRVLEQPLLKKLGEWSYFIYLYHFLIGYLVVFALRYLGVPLPSALTLILQIAIVVSVSALSQRYFEGPIRRLKKHWVFDTA